MYDIYEILSIAALFGIPLISAVFFLVSLVKFASTPKENTEKRRKWRILLIISSIIAGILVIAIAAFMVLMFFAMMHM